MLPVEDSVTFQKLNAEEDEGKFELTVQLRSSKAISAIDRELAGEKAVRNAADNLLEGNDDGGGDDLELLIASLYLYCSQTISKNY